jgi:hypothetical protein
MTIRRVKWASAAATAAAVAAAAGVGLVLGAAAQAAPPVAPAPKPAKKPVATKPITGEALPGERLSGGLGPRLDVVFVIDSTGSMGGIIDDGKREMRKIIDTIMSGDPRPDLRVGLVTYRDKGDDYVVKNVPLTRDYAAFDHFLKSIFAGGGGDLPEAVSQGLHVAVSLMNWDLDKNTARMMFLIGDAPAHTDYADGFDFEKEALIARDRKIVIHTIALASYDAELEKQFKRIATITGGTYKVLGPGGGVIGADPGSGTGADGDVYEEHDYSGGAAGAGAPADAPRSGLGRTVTDAIKAEAAKKGTVYAPTPAPAPKKKPK